MFGQNLLDLAVKLVRNEGNLQGQARRGPSIAGVLLFPLPRNVLRSNDIYHRTYLDH